MSSAKRILVPIVALVLLLASRGAAAATPGGHDFTPEVKTLARVAACLDSTSPVPAGYDKAVVDAHCQKVQAAVAVWRKKWLDKAVPFLAGLLGTNLPTTVIYPFGGGDLITLLAVYPDALDYTTLSLEGMGDPRPISVLAGSDGKARQLLGKRLAATRGVLIALLKMAWNTTIQLSKDSNAAGKDVLPTVLVQALLALEAHGYEVVDARFFKLDDSGKEIYLDDAAIATADAELDDEEAKLRRRKTVEENTLQVGAFTNVELRFRKRGVPGAPVKVFRHIAADLSDGVLKRSPGPLRFLAALAAAAPGGEISAMTKAASYLLWMTGFSQIRDFLLGHMRQMVSDDTGIPPRFAQPAFKQETYGTFAGAHFPFAPKAVAAEMVRLWKNSPKRPLPMRFGYPDDQGHPHLLFTHK
jgi:hypothetical protein